LFIPKIAYVSGGLTKMSETKRKRLRRFYESIGRVCEAEGLVPYIPHKYGDPKLLAHLTPAQIDRIDRLAVTQSYLLIAYVGDATTGGGIEVEMANHAYKPVILAYERKALEAREISRLVRGNPSIRDQVPFDTTREAMSGIKLAIQKFEAEILAENLPDILSLARPEREPRLF